MDRTEAIAAAPPRSQSRLSPVVFWVLLAAVLFRIVTEVMGRSSGDVGLVSWQPRGRVAAVAKSTNKPILYEFSAAWCGPCKLLDRDWENPEVAAHVNATFVPVRIIDRMREDGNNPEDIAELQRRYEITGFPALVAAAPDGRLLGKLEGYAGRDRLMRFLKDPGTAGSD
jgi:thiol:disulfide interchange protein